ncbi:hypothetical protein [Hymenobacter seoulensis]
MKSLLRLFLMIGLIVAGKFTKQGEQSSVQAAATKTIWQIPVRSASFFHNQPPLKRQVTQGGGSHFWQSTAPTTVSTTLE